MGFVDARHCARQSTCADQAGSLTRRALHSAPTAGVAKLVIRARLKIGCPSGRLGSTPSPGMCRWRCGARPQPIPRALRPRRQRAGREALRALELECLEEGRVRRIVERAALREVGGAAVRRVGGRRPHAHCDLRAEARQWREERGVQVAVVERLQLVDRGLRDILGPYWMKMPPCSRLCTTCAGREVSCRRPRWPASGSGAHSSAASCSTSWTCRTGSGPSGHRPAGP